METPERLKASLARMFSGWPFTNCLFTCGSEFQYGHHHSHSFKIEPYGKIKSNFFLETRNLIESKLLWSLTKFSILCRIAIIAGQNEYRTLWEKYFNTYLKPLRHLTANLDGMFLGRWCMKFPFFVSIKNSRWPPPQKKVFKYKKK